MMEEVCFGDFLLLLQIDLWVYLDDWNG
jgi:hypothetical protein